MFVFLLSSIYELSRIPKISFLNKVLKPTSDDKLVSGLVTAFSIIIYPLILLVGLLIMLVIGLYAACQRLIGSKAVLGEQRQKINNIESCDAEWKIFMSSKNIKIDQQFAGSLPWDSGDYVVLKSDPVVPYLENKIFGDWFLVDFDGVFLQKWNDPRNISCDLIFIDFTDFKVTELKNNLSTKDWESEKLSNGQVKFTFLGSEADVVYIVEQIDGK